MWIGMLLEWLESHSPYDSRNGDICILYAIGARSICVGGFTLVSFTMIWLSLLVVPVITAAAAAFLAGAAASLAVGWYSITSREGASGYFVVFLGLFGSVAGLVIGLIVCAIVQPQSAGGLGLAAAVSLGVVVLLAMIAAITARVLADVPPTIDRESLLLCVEVRPNIAESGAKAAAAGFLTLASVSHRTVRKSVRGPLWTEPAADISSSRISSGVVEIFTGRGKRMLTIDLATGQSASYFVPLPASPGRRFFNWSDWLPKAPMPAVGSELAYRFRVQKHFDPIRREAMGSFEIRTIAESFSEIAVDGHPGVRTSERFQILHNGSAVTGKTLGNSRLPEANFAATFEGKTAILINDLDESYNHVFQLITESDGKAVVRKVADSWREAMLVELDPEVTPPTTRQNRVHLAPPWLYRLGQNGVLDARAMAIHQFTVPSGIIDQSPPRCLALSHDERSFVRLVTVGPSSVPALAATDYVADQTHLLPIDRKRMHYVYPTQIDPAWVDHHFCWKRDTDGLDRLVERQFFETLPFRGNVEEDTIGGWRYVLYGVGEGIRSIIVDVLTGQFGGRPPLPGTNSNEQRIQLDGLELSLFYGRDYGRLLMLTMPIGTALELAQKIGRAIDAELATGKHDSLFDVDAT